MPYFQSHCTMWSRHQRSHSGLVCKMDNTEGSAMRSSAACRCVLMRAKNMNDPTGSKTIDLPLHLCHRCSLSPPMGTPHSHRIPLKRPLRMEHEPRLPAQ